MQIEPTEEEYTGVYDPGDSDESGDLDQRVLTLPSRNNTSWPTRDAIERVCQFAEKQLSENNYDGDGWEELQTATAVVRSVLNTTLSFDVLLHD